MIILVLCVLANSLIGVVFKLFDKYNIDVFQAIVYNYFVCVLTGFIISGHNILQRSIFHENWILYSIGLSICFLCTFLLMAYTVKGFGVGVAVFFQKMSFIAPIVIGIMVYAESSSMLKLLGIILAISAIVIFTFNEGNHQVNIGLRKWSYPLFLFVGSCIIDVGFLFVSANDIVQNGDIRFVMAIFLFAGMFGLPILLMTFWMKMKIFHFKNVIAGTVLGIPNLFTIYLLLLVLNTNIETSVVFTINNVGILLMSIWFGVVLFGEHFGIRQKFGFIIAILSIILVAYA